MTAPNTLQAWIAELGNVGLDENSLNTTWQNVFVYFYWGFKPNNLTAAFILNIDMDYLQEEIGVLIKDATTGIIRDHWTRFSFRIMIL